MSRLLTKTVWSTVSPMIGAQLVMIVQNTEYRIVGLDHQDTPLTL